ncbi:hypothetical protein MKEN_01216700 [Mycena kentingensis (nom. inval.)]|nr:hypothetical protein MKEN_01216700 [Mycena kentingensis (nom. inval.)]
MNNSKRSKVKSASSGTFHRHGRKDKGEGHDVGAAALTPAQARQSHREEIRQEKQRLAGMSASERREEDNRFNVPPPNDADDEMEVDVGVDLYADDVLAGAQRIEIGAGGEESLGQVGEEAREFYENFARTRRENRPKPKRKDRRSRRNRAKRVVDAFSAQMEAIGDAFEAHELFIAHHGADAQYEPPANSTVVGSGQIYVVDLLSASSSSHNANITNFMVQLLNIAISTKLRATRRSPLASYDKDSSPAPPTPPPSPSTTRTIEVFQQLHLRCPRLGKQVFIRSLCDLHTTPPRTNLETQFSIALDLYLRTKELVRQRVAVDLGRDHPEWRLKNACPCCFYKVKGEPVLDPPFFVTQDGNNSLKRLGKRPTTTALRRREGDYYRPREEVNKYGKEELAELLKGIMHDPDFDDDDDDGCQERWNNMKEEVTARAWGLYEETGVFIAVCRHSFCLVICDMVRSGELSKYGLAASAHLLRVLGGHLLGYDIGCKFSKWVAKHPLVAPLAMNNQFKSIVGAFHGCCHNRGCQLCNLPIRTRSPGVTRHASRFHRQQEIVNYFVHADAMDAYANLSSLLVSKYRHALEVLATEPELEETMRILGVPTRETFEEWLEEEKRLLKTLSKEPPEETMNMEYYQRLVNLAEAEAVLAKLFEVGMQMEFETGGGDYGAATAATKKRETARRHAIETRDKAMAIVQDLEQRNGIAVCWTPGMEEWQAAETLVRERRYRRALDNVQALVISRLLELAKVNMAGTGYRHRKFIEKALQARSKALRNAIERYNAVAVELDRPTLTWSQVVEYGFLAEFDLLRLAREDVREAAWARPGAREAMDAHYKLLRAVEERLRLNVEIQRLVTYMRDEERFLVYKERELEAKGLLARAVQVRKLRMVQGRFSAVHMQRLQKLSKLPGFTGCILPGEGASEERRVPEGFSMAVALTAVAAPEVLTTADGSADGLTAENVEGVAAAAEAAVGEDSDEDGESDEEHLELADDALEAIVRVTDQTEDLR